MKQRTGLGSGSVLVRLPGSAVGRSVGTQLRGEFPINHPSQAWWVSFALGTVVSFGGRVLFPFLLAQVVFSVAAKEATAGYSPSSPGTEAETESAKLAPSLFQPLPEEQFWQERGPYWQAAAIQEGFGPT